VSSWDGKVVILDSNQFFIKAQIYHQLKNNKINHVNNQGVAVYTISNDLRILFSNGNEDKRIQGYSVRTKN